MRQPPYPRHISSIGGRINLQIEVPSLNLGCQRVNPRFASFLLTGAVFRDQLGVRQELGVYYIPTNHDLAYAFLGVGPTAVRSTNGTGRASYPR